MPKSPVRNYNEVMETVRAFNEGLAAMEPEAGADLLGLLSYFRAWYYVPELDMVGPSKFVGYRGMSAAEYMERDDLDGRVSEPVLAEWFEVVGEGSPEGRFVVGRVQSLVERHRRSINRKARFCVPKGWKFAEGAPPRPPAGVGTAVGSGDRDGSRPIVEVFFRAFQSLYPEDQEALAAMIAARRTV